MISIIAAIAKNNIIGGDNKLLWHIPEDLKHFKDLTSNHTIIMGRKTFESLPGVLPKRHHIVLTKDKNYTVDSDSVTIVHNLKKIVDKYETSEEEIFVIGGGEIYSAFLPYCKNLYLTKIDEDLFLSTLAINQNEVKLEDQAQNFLIQKIANLAQTGDDSTSFKRVIDRIASIVQQL